MKKGVSAAALSAGSDKAETGRHTLPHPTAFRNMGTLLGVSSEVPTAFMRPIGQMLCSHPLLGDVCTYAVLHRIFSSMYARLQPPPSPTARVKPWSQTCMPYSHSVSPCVYLRGTPLVQRGILKTSLVLSVIISECLHICMLDHYAINSQP